MKIEVYHNKSELIISTGGLEIKLKGEVVLLPLNKVIRRHGIEWTKTGHESWVTEAKNRMRCAVYKWNKQWQLVVNFREKELTLSFPTLLDTWKAAYNGLSQARPGEDWHLEFKVDK